MADDYNGVCTALGHAISCWSGVESELARIYAVAIKSPEMGAPIESFYAALGFDSKLRMANIAMQATCRSHPDIIEKWNNLVNRAKAQAKIRNKLAHGAVAGVGQPPSADFWFVPYFGIWRDKQSLFGLLKKGQEGAEKITRDELSKIAKRYLDLAGDLQHLFLTDLVPITSGQKK